MRYFGMLQYSSVIQFGDFGFFSMTVNLNLLGVNLGSTAEPSLCYPVIPKISTYDTLNL